MKHTTWIVIGLACAALAGCSIGGGSDKAGGKRESAPVVLTFANFDGSPATVEVYAREVARQSKGSLRIEFKNGWRSDDPQFETDTIADVRAGKVDMGRVSARAFDTVGVKSFQPLMEPLAIDSLALQRRVLQGPLPERMLSDVERLDVVGLALLPGELRRPLGIGRPLVGADDYRGATIGIRSSDLAARTFEALGGKAVPWLDPSELRALDGTELGLAGIEFDRLDGPARTLAPNVVLWPRPLAVVMNRDAYDKLSDEQRRALRAAGRAAVAPMTEQLAQDDSERAGTLCHRGEVAFRPASPEQLRALRAAVEPVRREVHEDHGRRDAANQIAAMRAEIDPEPAPSCDSAGGRPERQGGTPVEGIWRMDSTASELAKIDPQAAIPENWGHQTFVVTAGRFAFTNENAQACLWGYGTYKVTPDTFELIFTDGGGKAPTGAANRPGENFHFRWTHYRDRLTLKPIEGKVSPPNFRVNTWRRQDGALSLSALSPHCRPPANALQP
jgi:TRAP-type transport system periplasmic protein